MAATELNERLDYLTSYSSQLVFVCSDKIKQQSKVVDDFLSQQNEQADLAVLTANELTPLATYREKLFRQLVSHQQSADFNRPLNQLLAPLNDHPSSILISIFQAEKLPIKLVKELWDLVLQGRFANNKHRINVLLMGLSNWAEDAKQRLSANSKQQPIVLSHHTEWVGPEQSPPSELEALIQAKRSQFAQRVKARGQMSYSAGPLHKKWWMLVLLSIFFISTFGGILGWQYPDKIAAIAQYMSLSDSGSVSVAGIQASNFEPQNEQAVELTPMITDVNSDTQPRINTASKTQSLLVTDWQTASAKLAPKPETLARTETVETEQTFEPLPEPQELITATEIPKTIQTDGAVNDYQVEDTLLTTPSTLPLASTNKNITNKIDAILIDPQILLQLPADGFVVQIAAMANLSILRTYIKEAQLTEGLSLYKTKRYGADWYVLLKDQHYSTLQAARLAITNLPEALTINSPFAKRISQIKQEITQTTT